MYGFIGAMGEMYEGNAGYEMEMYVSILDGILDVEVASKFRSSSRTRVEA